MTSDFIGCSACPETSIAFDANLLKTAFAMENNLLQKPSKPFPLEMISEHLQSTILTKLDTDLMRKAFAMENNLLKKPTKPFKMEMIPEDMQSLILIKMDQTSFTRMRRTNSHFSNYIDTNRHRLKIALFHNWYLSSNDEDTVDLTRGSFSDTYFSIGKNFQEDDIDESKRSTIVSEKHPFQRGTRDNDVKLYLKAVKLDKWLQRELTGVIKLNEFSMGIYTPVDETLWMSFLTSRIIKSSVSLDVSSVSSQLINCCVQTLRPLELYLEADERVDLGEHLKEVKKLHITGIPMDWEYSFLRNVEELEVSDPCDMPNSFDVIKVLEMWCVGESNLREMTYSTRYGSSKIPLHLLNGEKFNTFHTQWLVTKGILKEMASEAFRRDINMTFGDPPEAHKLIQNSSMKTAVCLYYDGHVLFKTIETGQNIIDV